MPNGSQDHVSLGLVIAGAAAVTVIVGILVLSNLDRIGAAFSGDAETAETQAADGSDEAETTSELSKLIVRAGDRSYFYTDGDSGAVTIQFCNGEGDYWSYTNDTSFIFLDDGGWSDFYLPDDGTNALFSGYWYSGEEM